MKFIVSHQTACISGGADTTLDIGVGINSQGNEPCGHANLNVPVNDNVSVYNGNTVCVNPNSGQVNTHNTAGIIVHW